MKNLLKIVFYLLLTSPALAQNTNISGVINTYHSVSNIQASTITVASTAGMSANDLLLIIQMQGATINQTNTSGFGNITAYQTAGNYEFVRICQVLSATQIQTTQIQRTYNTAANVQIITVPEYNDATVTGTLTASAWNGQTGGVLAFECSGKLTLNADIDLQGLGFRGGDLNTSSFSCSWLINNDDYFYDLSTGRGAKKGEGIATYITGSTAGRGKQANGGGGGNDHNSGGGGGSNGGIGGNGGERIAANGFSCSGPNTGRGGTALNYTLNKVFLGGGGGAGHENNSNTGTAGLNGGGIIIVKADTLVGNGQFVLADGESATATSQDGAGGGGAGGAVLFDVNVYSNTVNISANGSDGRDVSNVGSANCNGPGGGGSGGVFRHPSITLPANVNVTINGGVAGITLASSQSNCNVGGTNNAQAGANGQIIGGLSFVEPSNAAITIQNVITICANDSIFLQNTWQTAPITLYDTVIGNCADTVTETVLDFYQELTDTLNATICSGDSIIVNGTTYNTDILGATEVFIGGGQNGCDSTVTINIEVGPQASGVNTIQSCEPLLWLDGNVYNNSNNTAVFVIQNGSALGCDSTVTLNFIRQTIERSLTQIGFSLTSNATNATYQWFACDDDYIPLTGETSQTFNAPSNGFYAVEITQNGCTDTSNCVEIKGLNLNKTTGLNAIKIYPNPATNVVTVDLGTIQNATVSIFSMDGKQIYHQNKINSSNLEVNLNTSPGIYTLQVEENNQAKQFKLIIAQ